MFDIGFWELTLVSVVALLVLGPERLPGAVRTTVVLLRRARNVVATVKAEIEQELALEEVKASLEKGTPVQDLKTLETELRRPAAPARTAAEPERTAVDDDST